MFVGNLLSSSIHWRFWVQFYKLCVGRLLVTFNDRVFGEGFEIFITEDEIKSREETRNNNVCDYFTNFRGLWVSTKEWTIETTIPPRLRRGIHCVVVPLFLPFSLPVYGTGCRIKWREHKNKRIDYRRLLQSLRVGVFCFPFTFVFY